MGWLFSTATIGMSKKQFVETRIKPWSDGTRCVKKATVGNILYTVWERPGGHKFIGIDLLSYRKKDGWGYKDMDETCGPCERSCPLSFFDLVPCPPEGYAAAWRERVRAYHAEKKGRKEEDKKLVSGAELELVPGLKCGGTEIIEATIIENRGKKFLVSTKCGVALLARHMIKAVKEKNDGTASKSE